MNFRDLINTLDTINTPVLLEALTLSAVVALTAGYEQDDKVRIPKLADLAKQNNLEGLVDPVTGNYVSNEGDEEDEVPFEIAEKLSAAGLLPTNARLPQAGWFDNNRTFNAANSNLRQQSSTVSAHHDMISEKMHKIRELINQYIKLRDANATSKMGSEIGEKPVLPSNAPSSIAAKMTPTFASQTMAGMHESAGLADALMESFGSLYEDSWQDSALPGIKKRSPTTVPDRAAAGEFGSIVRKQQPWSPAATTQGMNDTGWLGKSTSSPTWTAPSNSTTAAPSPTTEPKPSAAKSAGMNVDDLAKSSSKGIGAGEKLAKTGAKELLGKTAARLIPGALTAYDAADAYDRYKKGDYIGAGISGAAGLASLVPGIGTGVGVALDAANLYRDWDNPNSNEPTTTDTPPASNTEKLQTAPPVNPTAPVTPVAPVKPVPHNGHTRSAPKGQSNTRSPAAKSISANEFQQYLKSLGANNGDISTSVNRYILGK